jgi:hypothetical protein
VILLFSKGLKDCLKLHLKLSIDFVCEIEKLIIEVFMLYRRNTSKLLIPLSFSARENPTLASKSVRKIICPKPSFCATGRTDWALGPWGRIKETFGYFVSRRHL